MSIKQIRITVGNESGTLMELTKVLADQSRLINEVQKPCLGQCSKGERARTPPPIGQNQ